MRTAPINIGRCARFLYDDEEENVWKGKKGKILPRTEKEICRGRCLHRPVAVCPIYNPWKNAMTLGQRAHNVHPYGLYGENACFNMF